MKRKIVIGIATVAIMAIAIIGVGLDFCDLLSLKEEIQDEKLYDFFSLVNIAGADDLTGETPYVRLDPIAFVEAGEPLVVTGTSNRQQGYVIIVTCKGPVELVPHTVQIVNDTFEATFDTTGALTGEYIVKAYDGNAYFDEVDIIITGAGAELTEGLKEIAEIVIEAEKTRTVEFDAVKLTVTGVAYDPIRVETSPLSKYVIFKEGIYDTPKGANYHTNWFTDTIDSDGIRRYAVEVNDTGTYTIKVTVTGGDRVNDSDTVNITVLEKEVTFDLPDEVVIGDKIKIKGTSTSGTYVSVYVDDTLYKKLVNIVIEDGEFEQEVRTTDVGMDVPGTLRLKAWIDCDKATGEERPTRSPGGEGAILLLKPSLTAELSVPSVALEDNFMISGSAPGSDSINILAVAPRGSDGSLIDGTGSGIYATIASVSEVNYTFTRKIYVGRVVDTGSYLVAVLSPGLDGKYNGLPSGTGVSNFMTQLQNKYCLAARTQEQILVIIQDAMIDVARSDDHMRVGYIKVESPYVKLDPIAAVNAGTPLVAKGASNRQQGFDIVVTCKGPVELAPSTVKVENDTFGCVFDTTGATTGEYIVKADDGDGHVDEVDVFITGIGMLEAEAAVKEAAEVAKEVVKEITATPEPTPSFQELIEEQLKEKTFGQILFNPSQKMKVAVKELVEVRITKNTTEEIREELRKGLKGRGNPQIDKIEVKDSMKVRLTGDKFDIIPLSTEKQPLRPEGFTEWSWNVNPKESGTQVLYLTVTARLLIPDQAEQEIDLEVMHKNISVDVNPPYSIKCFIESHWMWIVGTIITIVIAAIGIRKKRGEER